MEQKRHISQKFGHIYEVQGVYSLFPYKIDLRDVNFSTLLRDIFIK